MLLEEAIKDFLVECEIRRYTPIKTVKSFIQYCYKEGYGGFNTKLKSFKWVKEETPVIRAFEPRDVRLMLENCRGSDFMPIRGPCVLTMLFETGIRCWELCCIKPKDVKDEYIHITAGKNHKERIVPISAPLKKAIMRYNRVKENCFAYRNVEEFSFLSFHGRQLTNSAVEHIFKQRGEGIVDVRASPHTARHFFAVQSLKNGMDLYQLSRQLGHSSLAITSVHLRTLQDEDIAKSGKNRSMLMNL